MRNVFVVTRRVPAGFNQLGKAIGQDEETLVCATALRAFNQLPILIEKFPNNLSEKPDPDIKHFRYCLKNYGFYSLSASQEHGSKVVHWSVTVSKFEVI